MFSQLFQEARTIRSYREAPLARSRLEHLTHCAERGYASATLRQTAYWQLVVVRTLDLQEAATVSRSQIETAADGWASGKLPATSARKSPRKTRQPLVRVATQWLGFAGLLDSELVPSHPHGERLAQYAEHMRAERALAESTIAGRQRRAEEFLARHCPREDSLRTLSARDLDAAIARKAGADGCSRVTLRAYQYDLRYFLRYAAAQGWCDRQLAESIRPAPAYQLESLPAGPAWPDVERLLHEMDGVGAANARARAVLLLCAVYGVRSGEIRRLRLADLDWERETILFRRSKQAGQHLFPLQRSVGEAIIRYLREGRPRRADRPEVFLTLRAPVRPLTTSVVYIIVSQQLRKLESPLRHHGPHALRHAHATRLLQQGFDMKQIGDCLGHRDPAATAVYAKVDLTGLRQVADFSLQGVLP